MKIVYSTFEIYEVADLPWKQTKNGRNLRQMRNGMTARTTVENLGAFLADDKNARLRRSNDSIKIGK